MAKKRKKRKSNSGPIFVSPDGGHTVYEQMKNGEKRLVEEDDHARALRELQEDSEMFGFEAYELRKKYPTLQKAYDNYKTIWHMVNDE
jgi:hypothetical protein